MHSPHRVPLTAEWSNSGGTPWRDALLRDPDQLHGQHGSTEDLDSEPDQDELNIPLRAKSSSTSAATWTTNLKSRGVDALIKIDVSSLPVLRLNYPIKSPNLKWKRQKRVEILKDDSNYGLYK